MYSNDPDNLLNHTRGQGTSSYSGSSGKIQYEITKAMLQKKKIHNLFFFVQNNK